MQAVADAGGNPALVERQQVVSVAGKVQQRQVTALIFGPAYPPLDFASAAETPAELDKSAAVLSRVLNGCWSWESRVRRMRSRSSNCVAVSSFLAAPPAAASGLRGRLRFRAGVFSLTAAALAGVFSSLSGPAAAYPAT